MLQYGRFPNEIFSGSLSHLRVLRSTLGSQHY